MKGLSEKQKKAMERLKAIDPENEFFWNDEMTSPQFIKGKLSGASTEAPETIARRFLDENRDLLDMQEDLDERLEISHREKDKQGFNHLYFHQTLNGLPVFEGSTQVHINPGGEVVAYKDYRVTDIDLPMEPRIPDEIAIETALQELGETAREIETKAALSLYRGEEKQLHLAWEVEFIVDGELGARYYFIDAHTGQLLYKFAQIRDAMSQMTYTARNREVLPGDLILQDDQLSDDDVAQAAHDNAAVVYQYYQEAFDRDSYDDQGSPLVSTVHFKEKYNNAFWSDWYKQMVYGDGDGVRWKPLALALDIVAHELTHAVTASTARFVYAEEAGALDESFADFFGVMVSNDDPITDWQMGEGVFTPFLSGDALRDLSDPPQYRQPDHMDDFNHLSPGELPDSVKNDHGYVHSNSGIPNKVGYLVVAGGTHHGITVEGIGRDKAEQICYLALTVYLSSSTRSRWTFKQARYAMLNACRQLYGDSGDEYASIKNAWAAVGVGEPSKRLRIVHKEVFPNIPIPDSAPAGIRSSIHIPEPGLVKDISVIVDIKHTYIGDLRVTLTSPAGESVVLHDRKGRSTNDILRTYDLESTPNLRTFMDDPIQGDWVLSVSDHARIDTGRLAYWSIRCSAKEAEKKSLQEETSPNLPIPDNDPEGIESLINIDKSGKVVNMSVSVDIEHTWIGDLRVILVLPSADEVLLHERSGYSRKDIKKTYSTKSDQKVEPAIGKDINGDWRLKVIDLASEDTGTLNRWSMDLTYQ